MAYEAWMIWSMDKETRAMSQRTVNIKNGIQKVYKEYVMSWVWIQSVAEIGRAERQRIQSITEITIPFHSRWKILTCQTSNQRTE